MRTWICEHKLISLFLFALVLRLLVYFPLNYVVYAGELEHPDSQGYHRFATHIVEVKWEDDGILSWLGEVLRREPGSTYPEYGYGIAVLYKLLSINRLWPELLNMVISSLVPLLGFLTLRSLSVKVLPPVVGGLLLAVEPYSVYLSTQLLKESVVIFSVALVLLTLFRTDLGRFTGLTLVLLGLLRFKFALLLGVVGLLSLPFWRRSQVLTPVIGLLVGLTAISFLNWAALTETTAVTAVYLTSGGPGSNLCAGGMGEEERIVCTASEWVSYRIGPLSVDEVRRARTHLTGLTPLAFLEGEPTWQDLIDELGLLVEGEILTQEEGTNLLDAVLTGRVLVFKGKVQPPVIHMEFFETRAAYPVKFLLTGQVPWITYPRSVVDYLTFPQPWRADTLVEYGFAGYMVYWYLLLFVLLVALSRRQGVLTTVWPLLILGASIGLLLTLTTPGASSFVRWRLPTQYPIILSIAIAFAYLPSLKRFLDIVLASLVGLFLLPVVGIISLFLLWQEGDGLLFRQQRMGKGGHPFTAYKFVTMGPGSDGLPVLNEDDPRITRVGRFLRKFALDEIPQIVNVLKGEMSIVGPRALAVWDHNRANNDIVGWYKRLSITPGMVGLAQVKGIRSDNQEKLFWDVEYIARQSLLFDFKIFLRGVVRCFKGRW